MAGIRPEVPVNVDFEELYRIGLGVDHFQANCHSMIASGSSDGSFQLETPIQSHLIASLSDLHQVRFFGRGSQGHYNIRHTRFLSELESDDPNDPEDHAPHTTHAFLMLWVQVEGSYFGFEGNINIKLEVKFLAVNPECMEQTWIIEGSTIFRIPYIPEDSPLYNRRYKLICQLASRMPDARGGHCWGPDTKIKLLRIELMQPIPQTSLHEWSLRNRFAFRPDTLFVSGCVCRGQVNCSFCHGSVPAYDRIDPLIQRGLVMRGNETDERGGSLPLYEFAHWDQRLDPAVNGSTPPPFRPNSQYLAKSCKDLRIIFGRLPGRLQSVLDSWQLHPTEELTTDLWSIIQESEEQLRAGTLGMDAIITEDERAKLLELVDSLILILRQDPPESLLRYVTHMRDCTYSAIRFARTISSSHIVSEDAIRVVINARREIKVNYSAVRLTFDALLPGLRRAQSGQRALALPRRPVLFHSSPGGSVSSEGLVQVSASIHDQLEILERLYRGLPERAIVESFAKDVTAFEEMYQIFRDSASDSSEDYRAHQLRRCHAIGLAILAQFVLFERLFADGDDLRHWDSESDSAEGASRPDSDDEMQDSVER